MPGVPADAYKAKISAVHVVAKGRQGVEAANSVQVGMLPDSAPLCVISRPKNLLRKFGRLPRPEGQGTLLPGTWLKFSASWWMP